MLKAHGQKVNPLSFGQIEQLFKSFSIAKPDPPYRYEQQRKKVSRNICAQSINREIVSRGEKMFI